MRSEPVPELVICIEREADVVVAQRRARLRAAEMGFSRRAQWEVATAVSEAATNILKYARSGRIVFRAVEVPERGLEFEATDGGAGIPDLAQALKDGVSETRDLAVEGDVVHRRGLGLGLGAIHRLMDEVQVLSNGNGTRVIARKTHAGRRS